MDQRRLGLANNIIIDGTNNAKVQGFGKRYAAWVGTHDVRSIR